MPPTITVTLPKQKKAAVDNLFRHTLLFAGEKKIGKTSFVTQWPDHFMLECEPGNASHLTANYEDIFDFDTAVAYIDEIHKHPTYCKVLIIDEIQSLYNYCAAKVRKEQKLDLDEKFTFVQWGMTRNYFQELTLKLQRLQIDSNIGVVFTAHTEMAEIETRTGKKIARLQPRLTGQCNSVLENFVKFCGVILAAPDSSRYMQVQGDDYVLAYNGFPDHFLVPNGNKLVQIGLGFSPVTAFENFNSAYNNTYIPVNVKAPAEEKAQQTAPTAVNTPNKKFSFKKG